MKLKTMLLPTGEFIIVGSEAPEPFPDSELFAKFRDQTGAAAVLFARHEIDVEDALFDENARRAEPEPEDLVLPSGKTEDGESFTRVYLPRVEIAPGGFAVRDRLLDDFVGDPVLKPEFSATFETTQVDDKLVDLLYGGAKPTPSGLVDLGHTGRTGDARGPIPGSGEPGAHPVVDVAAVGEPEDFSDLEVDSEECPCWPAGTDAEARCGGCPKAPLEVGDRVKINAPSFYRNELGLGRPGEIKKFSSDYPENHALVEFYDDYLVANRHFIPLNGLEKLPPLATSADCVECDSDSGRLD